MKFYKDKRRKSKAMKRAGLRFARRACLIAVFALLLVACQNNEMGETTEMTASDYPNSEILVDTAWVAERTEDLANTRIIDVRRATEYSEAHIPGAVNIPVNEIASTIDGIPMEFDEQEVRTQLANAGLEPEMTVVVYDDLGMMNAARFFWTLEYVGHDDVRLLDGGWNAWTAEEREITDAAPALTGRDYPIDLQPDKLATAEEVLEKLDEPSVAIVDARSPAEYTGEVAYADRGGHIPGAVNLVWLDALTGGDAVYTTEDDWREQLTDPDVERFKPANEIATLLDQLGLDSEQEVITYCQTLWRGAHVYFLLRLMGFEHVRGYDGSWAEWGNRSDLPVETGTTARQEE